MKNFLCATAALLSLLVNLAPRAAAHTTEPPPPGVEQLVEGILRKMTLEEKIDLPGGTDGFCEQPRRTGTRSPRSRATSGASTA